MTYYKKSTIKPDDVPRALHAPSSSMYNKGVWGRPLGPEMLRGKIWGDDKFHPFKPEIQVDKQGPVSDRVPAIKGTQYQDYPWEDNTLGDQFPGYQGPGVQSSLLPTSVTSSTDSGTFRTEIENLAAHYGYPLSPELANKLVAAYEALPLGNTVRVQFEDFLKNYAAKKGKKPAPANGQPAFTLPGLQGQGDLMNLALAVGIPLLLLKMTGKVAQALLYGIPLIYLLQQRK